MQALTERQKLVRKILIDLNGRSVPMILTDMLTPNFDLKLVEKAASEITQEELEAAKQEKQDHLARVEAAETKYQKPKEKDPEKDGLDDDDVEQHEQQLRSLTRQRFIENARNISEEDAQKSYIANARMKKIVAAWRNSPNKRQGEGQRELFGYFPPDAVSPTLAELAPDLYNSRNYLDLHRPAAARTPFWTPAKIKNAGAGLLAGGLFELVGLIGLIALCPGISQTVLITLAIIGMVAATAGYLILTTPDDTGASPVRVNVRA